jgi:hypothetical protein
MGVAWLKVGCGEDSLQNRALGTQAVMLELVGGDGVVEAPEMCDAGQSANDGAYAGCRADCTSASYCGDATLGLRRRQHPL